MTNPAPNVPILTKSQADCLMALRNPGFSPGRIAVTAKLDLKEAEAALRILNELGFARLSDSELWLATPHGETCSFETAADRPRHVRAGRSLPPRLPVRSDRVRMVLQTITDEHALRIKDVRLLTGISSRSMNALMQYLKRKRLVAKAGQEFDAPYSLTDLGRTTLSDMSLRLAA